MNLTDLKKPFDPERVSWRVGSTTQDKSKGMMLAYIDARDVQDRLDDVCGAENWQCRYSLQDKTTICEIAVKVGEDWVWKADGAGATDVEAEKGQLSDSFKRAAVKWGIGRYLYDVDPPWVEVEPAGRSVKMKASEKPKLLAALRRVGQASAAPEKPIAAAQKGSSGDVPGTVSTTSAAPKPSGDDKREKAIAWSKAEIAKVDAFKDLKEFDSWRTPEFNAALKRLEHIDPKSYDNLCDAIDRCLSRLNPIGA